MDYQYCQQGQTIDYIDLAVDQDSPPIPRTEIFMNNNERKLITFNIYIIGNVRDGHNFCSYPVNIHK